MEPMKLPGPKAKALIKRDSAVISPSYPRGVPFVMDHGKGTEVWDVDGNRFLDFAAGIAVVSTGHSHPKVVKAIQEQAEQFIHISSDFYHEKWIALAEKLDEIAPFGEEAQSFMTNSGTEAVETAIKLARYHTGRTNFIGFTGAFHGRTMGAVTFTASKTTYHRGFYPLMNGVVHAPFPNPYRPILDRQSGEDYGETVVRYIEDEILGHIVPPDEVAGILVETIQGEGGYIVPPPGFFPPCANCAIKHNILLIADEVQCGMGRTGKWWAIEHFDVEPDIITTAKGIASGMPLGACIARNSVMDWPRGCARQHLRRQPARLRCRPGNHRPDRKRIPGKCCHSGHVYDRCPARDYGTPSFHRRRARHRLDDRRGIRQGPQEQGPRRGTLCPYRGPGLRARPDPAQLRQERHALRPAAEHHPERGGRGPDHLRRGSLPGGKRSEVSDKSRLIKVTPELNPG